MNEACTGPCRCRAHPKQTKQTEEEEEKEKKRTENVLRVNGDMVALCCGPVYRTMMYLFLIQTLLPLLSSLSLFFFVSFFLFFLPFLFFIYFIFVSYSTRILHTHTHTHTHSLSLSSAHISSLSVRSMAAMDTAAGERPSAPEQCAEIARIFENTPMRHGDTWFILGLHWWRSWKTYTGFKDRPTDASSNIGIASLQPGPVSNEDVQVQKEEGRGGKRMKNKKG